MAGFNLAVLSLFIGAGVFLTGTILFSECLRKNASRGTTALFRKISDNRFAGYGIGFMVTAIIQSSAATTITVVGLVNAGMLTLLQAASIMLGAQAGTTSTLFLVSLSSFDIRHFFMALGFVGALIRIITKQSKIVNIADLFISFGILFVGLSLMSSALRDNTELREFFIDLFQRLDFPLLLIFFGMVFTFIIQSSTASTSLFLMMMLEGLLSFESAMFLGLGSVVGTTFVPIFASLTANTNAKRAALLNCLFAVIGVSVFTGIIWPLKVFILPVYEHVIPLALQLPVFQLVYNLTAALILIWFTRPLSDFVCLLLKCKEKQEPEEKWETSYIEDSLLETPSIAIDLTKKEIVEMMARTRANLVLAFDTLASQDLTYKKKIKKEEEHIDFLHGAISKFIVKLSGGSISKSEDILLGSFIHVINDIERVGDYARKMLKEARRMKKNNYKFSQKSAGQLQQMFSKLIELFDLSAEIFQDRDAGKLNGVFSLDKEIDSLKSSLALGHLMWLKAGQYVMAGGEFFYSTISDMERIADHLTNIALSVSSHYQSGEQTEEPDTED